MISKDIPSLFEETIARQRQQSNRYQFTVEVGLFIVLLFGLFMVEINNLNYNTVFLDEAINAVVGEDLLQGNFSRNAVTFHFGSYLYPALSAILNELGGVTALRLASTLTMCLAAVCVYFSTRKLFGHQAGLFSMLLFSFSGSILNLGQLAVYDSVALPFLAAALFFLVAASTSRYYRRHLLIVASLCGILATLSKYISLIYLPALFITALILFWLNETPLRQAVLTLSIYFVFPILLVWSFYAIPYWQELMRVLQEQGFSASPRWLILGKISQEIGLVLLLALTGLALLVSTVTKKQNYRSPLLFGDEQSRLKVNTFLRSNTIWFFVLLLLLVCTWLAAPLHHWLTGNRHSLWKSCAYSLIFLSPLAGYCVATFVDAVRSRNRALNLLGVLVLCAGVVYFADHALDSNWSFHQSWPNTTGLMTYLRNSGLDENSRVLAEGMDIYEYYFDFGADDREVWNNFWYMDYGGVSGQEGALAAIRDRAPDFVIVEDYYLAGIRERVTPLLIESGYVVGWEEKQELRSGGTIILQVFIKGKEIS